MSVFWRGIVIYTLAVAMPQFNLCFLVRGQAVVVFDEPAQFNRCSGIVFYDQITSDRAVRSIKWANDIRGGFAITYITLAIITDKTRNTDRNRSPCGSLDK